MLGERGSGDVPVRTDDDETDGVGIEPGLEPAGGIADDGDILVQQWVGRDLLARQASFAG